MPTLVKKYLCVICGKREVIESIVEHMLEGDVPDVSNCDFSTYSDHKVSGGKLLATRPELNWKTLRFYKLDNEPPANRSGCICNECLTYNGTVATLSAGGHIKFVDDQNLKNSKW